MIQGSFKWILLGQFAKFPRSATREIIQSLQCPQEKDVHDWTPSQALCLTKAISWVPNSLGHSMSQVQVERCLLRRVLTFLHWVAS